MHPSLSRNVRSPLGFFTLVVLIAEAILGAIAGRVSGPDFTLLLASMVAIILMLILIVAYLAYRRPEALTGTRSGAHSGPCSVCRPRSVLGRADEPQPGRTT